MITFNTLAELQASTLKINQYVDTLGKDSIGDMEGALYIVRESNVVFAEPSALNSTTANGKILQHINTYGSVDTTELIAMIASHDHDTVYIRQDTKATATNKGGLYITQSGTTLSIKTQ